MNESNYQNDQHDYPQGQQIIINQIGGNSNGIGIAGFVLALVGLLLGIIPGVGWLLWLLGLVFSCIGMFKKPRGLAIAGFVISLICLVVILLYCFYVVG